VSSVTGVLLALRNASEDASRGEAQQDTEPSEDIWQDITENTSEGNVAQAHSFCQEVLKPSSSCEIVYDEDEREPRPVDVLAGFVHKFLEEKDSAEILRNLKLAVRAMPCALEGQTLNQSQGLLACRGEEERLWEEACKARASREFDKAAGYCKSILGKCADHHDAKAMLEEIAALSDKARQLFGEIEECIDGRSIIKVAYLVVEAEEIYPRHPASSLVWAKVKARMKTFRQLLNECLSAIQAERWSVAEQHAKGMSGFNGDNIAHEIASLLHEVSSNMAYVLDNPSASRKEKYTRKNKVATETVKQLATSLDNSLKSAAKAIGLK